MYPIPTMLCKEWRGWFAIESVEFKWEQIKGRGREYGWADGLQNIWTDLDQKPALTSAKLNKSIWNSDFFFFFFLSFVLFNIKRYLLYWKFAKTAFCLKMKSEFHMHT